MPYVLLYLPPGETFYSARYAKTIREASAALVELRDRFDGVVVRCHRS